MPLHHMHSMAFRNRIFRLEFCCARISHIFLVPSERLQSLLSFLAQEWALNNALEHNSRMSVVQIIALPAGVVREDREDLED